MAYQFDLSTTLHDGDKKTLTEPQVILLHESGNESLVTMDISDILPLDSKLTKPSIECVDDNSSKTYGNQNNCVDNNSPKSSGSHNNLNAKRPIKSCVSVNKGSAKEKDQLIKDANIVPQTEQVSIKTRSGRELKTPAKFLEEKLFNCSVCTLSFSTQFALDAHIKDPSNKHLNCTTCGNVYNSKQGLCMHCFVASRDNKHQDGWSDQTSSNELIVLVGSEERPDSKRNSSQEGMSGSPENGASESPEAQVSATDVKPGYKICKTCGKTYTSAYLTTHMRIHRGDKPYRCNVCTAEFTSHSNYSQHKRTYPKPHSRCVKCNLIMISDTEKEEHVCGFRPERPPDPTRKKLKKNVPAQRNRICDICGKGFSEKRYLDHHKLTVHEGKKPFQCDVCGKSLTKHIKQHMMIHNQVSRYKCDICGRISFSKHHLKVHQRTHTDEYPFVCETCGKAVRTKSALNVHMKTHTEARVYECDICGKSFPFQQTLMIHKKRHTGNKDIVCEYCNKTFYSVGLKNAHRKKVHYGVKTSYQCSYCDKVFSTTGSRTRHYGRFHKDETQSLSASDMVVSSLPVSNVSVSDVPTSNVSVSTVETSNIILTVVPDYESESTLAIQSLI